MQDRTSTNAQIIDSLPRKTVEYFATTYTHTTHEQAAAMPTDELITKISKCGMLSKVLEVYDETIRSVEKEKNNYTFFVKSPNGGPDTPLSCDQVIEALDNSHLFGKAVFMLLIAMGSMETGHEVIMAVKKEKATTSSKMAHEMA